MPEAIGVTPGSASTARKGSPNAPGKRRTSAREKVLAPGGGCFPYTVTSIGFGGGGGGGAAGVAPGAGTLGASGSGGAGFGATKRISAFTVAATGLPLNVAG